MKRISEILIATGFAAMFSATASADPITVNLDSWNVDDINNSGDYVEAVVQIDSDGYASSITFKWIEGDTTDDLWTAIGLDTIFYNATAAVTRVVENGIDTSSNWKLNFGGNTAGGGFGSFASRKNLEGGGTGGIDPSWIRFEFDPGADLAQNSSGAYFAVHVRYGNDCSGWASDGTTSSDTGETTTCRPVQVPEPASLGLLGVGLLGLALTRRRPKVAR